MVAQQGSPAIPFSLPTQRTVGSGITEHDRIRHQLANEFPGIVPVIVGPVIDLPGFPGAAIKAVAAICAIEPYREDVTIVRQKFPKLVSVISNVFGTGIILVVAIPR